MSEVSAKNPRLKWGLRLIPFFLSASLFLSGFFVFFAPMPLLLVGLTQGVLWLIAASIVNGALVYFASGPTQFQCYLLGVVGLALLMPFFLKKKGWSVEKTTSGVLGFQIAVILATLAGYAQLKGVSFVEEAKSVGNQFLDLFMQSINSEARTQILADRTYEEWAYQTLRELPAAIVTTLLIAVWINLYLLVSMNPNRILSNQGLDRKAFREWRNAEWLVWPTILSWGVALFTEKGTSEVAVGFFKVFMTAYAIQGMAVLGVVFDAWRIRGFLRMFLLFVILIAMLPLLLGIGFFDQWFDFRSKIRQSS